MGVQGLWKLLECSGRPVNPETLEGKILAVDISIWLNQAVKGARDRHGNAIQNAHLLTLFHRLCKLLFFRIRPIFVFDGEAPQLKKQTLAKRRQKKDTAASEAKKTNEKLLKTFLKRQAVKAALSGSNNRNEEFPSLSQVQRKEEEDIYALPPLEENERNSSEEEEEREWKERMDHKHLLQDEILANPNSVDIDSEDFNSLPPEVKHEILTDMKEFAKRRRTLYEAMPEDSNDFSQYQLKGLLKKNNLNRCLNNVRKEMNQQHMGELCAQFETEGGFMKEVETRRLISEDTSHYILIKGLKSKAEEKKDDVPEQAVPSSSSDMPKTYLDMKLASAHRPKKTKDSVPGEAPPSPRTLLAIQEAMMESSSDEDPPNSGMTQSYEIASESVGIVDGSVSPRTIKAIQEALKEDEIGLSRKRPVEICDGSNMEQPKAKVLVISSSDEEDEALVIESGDQMAHVISEASHKGESSATGHTSGRDKSISSLAPVTLEASSEMESSGHTSGRDKSISSLAPVTLEASCEMESSGHTSGNKLMISSLAPVTLEASCEMESSGHTSGRDKSISSLAPVTLEASCEMESSGHTSGNDKSISSLAPVTLEASCEMESSGHTSGNDKLMISSMLAVTNQSELPHKLYINHKDNKDQNVQGVKTTLFHSKDIPLEGYLKPFSSDINIPASIKPLDDRNLQDPSSNLVIPISELEKSDLKLSEKTNSELTPSKKGTDIHPSAYEPSVSSSLLQKSPVLVASEAQEQAALLPPQQKATEEDTTCNQEESTANVPDIRNVPLISESIPIVDEESDKEKEMDSDSDGSFIEVESDLGDSNSNLAQTTESTKDTMERQINDAMAAESTSTAQLENSVTEDEQAHVQIAALQQNEESQDREAESNEWQDISLEELESLENNLFVQQTSLQAQRQQQERVAASVTGQMYLESQELLRLFGIPYVVAPMEAEAQCAILDLTDQTSGTITDDSDIWLFGARHVYKNFFSQNKYVEYYQFSDMQNQLGLDRSKLINLAYLMGSDYTEGIPSVGYVSAMEILNEFSGHGLEPLMKFKEWWTEAQKNKKTRPNPQDTKVKKKLRNLELHPAFPNPAVADAYMKPVVDDSKGAFAWGRPDLEEIREFCESRFGWYRSKTDDVLLPVLKQLNTQQTQLRIDSFFRLEKHDAHGVKSQRLRRAVTCMKRKERDNEALEVEEATGLMAEEVALEDKKNTNLSRNRQKGKKKNEKKLESPPSESVEGGFLGSGAKPLSPKNEKSFGDNLEKDTQKLNSCTNSYKQTKPSKSSQVVSSVKTETLETSSSSDDEDKVVLVAAKPVFQGKKRKPRTLKGQRN
ncbi:DNA excision repair protein ERCC-5 [Hyla sarda]|uniref:DNA excision repair protein ERCC-5 n=1 Tax=Hyla sarda TaxID=327740 RepID=UPI0024C23DF6|nr:DNA excision repair protein ERCC-5 [Hyla sarda]XP_056411672.1 DNA excision repair protein ERCC-5 [Hyla sarda]XP_056411673.1 DNA excision repair protein ERCC-5 [Hyla sarda]